ncbi:hypothetical protein ABZ923_06660 [Streptomyces sp. NPDC046881]|uniref:hypothetical protein n=1 Tax=Streptomyces sp. NPDC046881 TaxID=3155374 RepID=UPI0033FF2DEB
MTRSSLSAVVAALVAAVGLSTGTPVQGTFDWTEGGRLRGHGSGGCAAAYTVTSQWIPARPSPAPTPRATARCRTAVR